jgi:hypothetical protein
LAVVGGSLIIARILRLFLIIISILGLGLLRVVVVAPQLAEALLEICLLLRSCLGDS